MTRKSVLLAAGTVIAMAAPTVIGCSAGGGQGKGPFTLPPCTAADCGTSHSKGPVVTNHIYDIEILNLHNYSSRSVRLVSVQMIRPAEGIRVINVRAYPLDQTQGGGAIDEGDLPKGCPEFYKPHPVTDVTVAQHADSNWVIIIAFKFERSGRYRFGTAKIGYETADGRGWQYFGLPDVRVRTVPVKSNPGLYSPLLCGPGSGPG